jgi:hypothetical protein
LSVGNGFSSAQTSKASAKGAQGIDLSSELAIAYTRVADLKVNPRNARTHSKRQIRQIAQSIEIFGFTNPVLVDKENTNPQLIRQIKDHDAQVQLWPSR